MLELKNVTKTYLRRKALDDVSLAIEPGRTCLLLGPNGSGKTTMMKLIAGLSRPTSGEIRLNGQAIGAATKARSRWAGSASARPPRPISPTCPPKTISIII